MHEMLFFRPMSGRPLVAAAKTATCAALMTEGAHCQWTCHTGEADSDPSNFSSFRIWSKKEGGVSIIRSEMFESLKFGLRQ